MEWLKLSEEERKISLEQASANTGISIKAIEKDWWVTLVLRALFQSQFRSILLFKGGTSLSKCWNLIDRFSEDIDLAIDRSYFINKTDDKLSHNDIKDLRRQACEFTSTKLKDELITQLETLGVPNRMVTVEATPIDPKFKEKDPQELLITYPSVSDPHHYLKDVVKIEVSIRSMKDPWSNCAVQSILSERLPQLNLKEKAFEIPTIEPKRTFLEKVFLMHEQFQRETEKIVHFRMSRHLYDMEKVMDTDHGMAALQDNALITAIVKHRAKFYKLPWVNYDELSKQNVVFIPPPSKMEDFKNDYAAMREQMFYGETVEFDALIKKLEELTQRFRQ